MHLSIICHLFGPGGGKFFGESLSRGVGNNICQYEYARLELTEPLIKKVILPGKLSILCDV